MPTGSRGISTVVGTVFMILILIFALATLIIFMRIAGEAFLELSEALQSKLGALEASNAITAFWYRDSHGDVVINVSSSYPRATFISSFVAIFEKARIVASRLNGTLTGIEIKVYSPSGELIYDSPKLPAPLCPSCVAVINITAIRGSNVGKLVAASVDLSSSIGVTSVLVKNIYAVGRGNLWLWRDSKLYANPKFKYVGIGTTNPRATLHVNGTVILQNLPQGHGSYVLMVGPNGELYRAPPIYAGQDNDWLWNGNKLYANPSAIAIGIGTTNPEAPLHVVSFKLVKYKLVIFNPNSYDLVDYQVRVNVSSIAFKYFEIVNASGNEIPYCFEQPNGECNTSRSNAIWIKVPRIPANGEVVLYIINSSTNRAVSGNEVFDFYDDFRALDETKWTVLAPSLVEVSNGALLLTASSNTLAMRTNANFGEAIVIEWRMKPVATRANDWDTGIAVGSQQGELLYLTDEFEGYWLGLQITYPTWSVLARWAYTTGRSTSDFSYHIYQAKINFTAHFIELRDLTDGREVSTTWSSAYDFSGYVWIFTDSDGGVDTSYDWIRVRKYADQDPIASIEPILEKDTSGLALLVEGITNVTNLVISGITKNNDLTRVLVINASGFVFWRDVSTIRDNDWFWNGNKLYANLSAIAVGIGTANPRAKLEVIGNFRVSNPSDLNRYFSLYFGALNDFEFNGSALVIHPTWGSSGYNPSGLVFISDNPSYVKVGIGTDNPQYRLDVAGDIRAIGASVYADYFKITESGNPTGWYLDYFPDNGRVSFVKEGLGEVISLLSNGNVGIGTTNPRYKLEVIGDVYVSGRLGTAGYSPVSGYPSGWYGGVHTWDVYAEGSVGVGSGGGLGVWITHENNNGKIILYANGKERIKLIASEGTIYADYFRFTESGNPTNFMWDYFPNTPVGNTIGVSHFDGRQWRGVFFINENGYVFAPRYYITEEGDEASPRWHLDYVPDNGRLTINYDYGGSPKEVAFILPSGSVWIMGNLSTHGFSPDSGYPPGWGGGIHTWDVYAEGSLGVGTNGELIVWISGTWDGQGFVYLNNTNNGAWARISRWTDRLEIASSNEIRFKIGGWGSGGSDIVKINGGGMDLLGHSIFSINDIFISGGDDEVGAIYGPNGNPLIIFDTNGMKFNVPESGGTRVLVLDSSGYVGWRDISTIRDNDWFWNGNYLYTTATRVGIGTSNPATTLDVVGTIRGINVTTDYLTISESGSSTGWYLDYFPDNGRVSFVKKGLGEVLSLLPNGNVGVGTTNPQYKLDVAGDIRANGASVYADYFWFTEGGNPTEFTWDFFPGAINGRNAIGVAVNGMGKMFVDTNGYIYTPRLYITEEGQETSPKWHIDYIPGTPSHIDFVNDENGKDVLQIWSNDAVYVRYHLYTDYLHLTEAGASTPWTIDFFPYSSSTPTQGYVGIAYNGNLVVEIHRDLMRIRGSLDLYRDLWMNGYDIIDVDDLWINGGGDHKGAIYGPGGDTGSRIVFSYNDIEFDLIGGKLTIDTMNGNGIYIRGLTENTQVNDVLVIDTSGKLYYRPLSSLSDNDWYWYNNYLRPNDQASGVDLNSKPLVNVHEIRGSNPVIYASSGEIDLESSGITYVHIYNPAQGGGGGYDVEFFCTGDDCWLVKIVSSIRYKTDVKPLVKYVNTSKIYDLEPVIYRDKFTNNTCIGLVAEQVAKVLPILVTFDSKGRPDAVRYRWLPVLMLPELKKHEMSIRYLNKTVEEMKSEIEHLERAASASGSIDELLWRALSLASLAVALVSLIIVVKLARARSG